MARYTFCIFCYSFILQLEEYLIEDSIIILKFKFFLTYYNLLYFFLI